MFDVAAVKLTMRDVANDVGCHVSTVSLALRGDKRIPDATRERVVLAAKRLGYQLHPLVSAWIKSRRARKSISGRLPLAYVDCRKSQHVTTDDSIFLVLRKEASRRGFTVSRFYIEDYLRNLDRLFDVLAVRNIPGVILGPGLTDMEFRRIEWERFSVVAVGDGPSFPLVHRVLEDKGCVVRHAFEVCRREGKSRIGFVLSGACDVMNEGNWLSSFAREQLLHVEPEDRVPVFFCTPGMNESALEQWFFEAKPDVVLGNDPSVVRNRSIRFYDITNPLVICYETTSNRKMMLAKATIELLMSLIVASRCGLPSFRRSIFVDFNSNPELSPQCSFVDKDDCEQVAVDSK